MQAVYQPQGGILASELCIAAHIQAAQSHGADFHSGEKVESWRVDPSSGIVTVLTDKEQYTAGKLVLTAGAWMPDIMPELQVRLWEQVLLVFCMHPALLYVMLTGKQKKKHHHASSPEPLYLQAARNARNNNLPLDCSSNTDSSIVQLLVGASLFLQQDDW